jgi:hypothetical protein
VAASWEYPSPGKNVQERIFLGFPNKMGRLFSILNFSYRVQEELS